VTISLHGVVFKGQGLLNSKMKEDPLLSGILGVKLHPGSMNVYATGDHHLFGQDIFPACVRNAGHLRALACVVRRGDTRRDGFIVRTELDCPFGPKAMPPPNTLFEILAESDLRTALGLESDEAPVEIDFDPSQINCYLVAGTRK
jgi:hypothetical protein